MTLHLHGLRQPLEPNQQVPRRPGRDRRDVVRRLLGAAAARRSQLFAEMMTAELTMPAHVKREPDVLLVVFERDGKEPASRHASGGEQACLFAVRLLIDYRARCGSATA
jgi:hypothetical protein